MQCSGGGDPQVVKAPLRPPEVCLEGQQLALHSAVLPYGLHCHKRLHLLHVCCGQCLRVRDVAAEGRGPCWVVCNHSQPQIECARRLAG